MSARNTRRCWIPDCGHRYNTGNGESFFGFPTDPIRSKMWCQAAGVADFVFLPVEFLHNNRHICGCHFELNQFREVGSKKTLKSTAVPTLLVKPLSDEFMLQAKNETVKITKTEAVLAPAIGLVPESLSLLIKNNALKKKMPLVRLVFSNGSKKPLVKKLVQLPTNDRILSIKNPHVELDIKRVETVPPTLEAPQLNPHQVHVNVGVHAPIQSSNKHHNPNSQAVLKDLDVISPSVNTSQLLTCPVLIKKESPDNEILTANNATCNKKDIGMTVDVVSANSLEKNHHVSPLVSPNCNFAKTSVHIPQQRQLTPPQEPIPETPPRTRKSLYARIQDYGIDFDVRLCPQKRRLAKVIQEQAQFIEKLQADLKVERDLTRRLKREIKIMNRPGKTTKRLPTLKSRPAGSDNPSLFKKPRN